MPLGSVQSCTSVFRALPTLEKTVDHCKLTLNLEENKLVFVFYCKHGKQPCSTVTFGNQPALTLNCDRADWSEIKCN